MVTLEDFSRLVAGIYAAAAAPERWQSAIGDIHRTIGGNGGALVTAENAIWIIQNAVLPVGAVASYTEYYSRLDYPLTAVANGPVGVIRTGAELITVQRHSEFYTDWMHPNGLEDGLLVRLSAGARPSCFILHTSVVSEPFDSVERVQVFGGLIRHLQQALRTQHHIDGLTHTGADLSAALDTVGNGILVIGADRRVLSLNGAAEQIVRVGDGLSLIQGHLTAASRHAEQALGLALYAALDGDANGIRHGNSLICERPSGARSFVIHVLPLHTLEEPGRPRAMVVLINPAREPEPSAALLQQLFHLTRTEADIALRVSRGADPKTVAEELAVSLPTVRTHLRRVFDKTGTHRQADLVRLILTLHPFTSVPES
ncbi:LuxR family transcriptional regulator [Mycobacterium dioxanotrophicus]|uniref:LuxR family transcriptional regulator n=2 Tax=Mycobacterium dioxanotrophicus TaxID=482462 RepID=A0A1Y0CDK0_9MYCO|nr:LuxR family transcriptional regulator [Mycobacterium dioxanotrophicus]